MGWDLQAAVQTVELRNLSTCTGSRLLAYPERGERRVCNPWDGDARGREMMRAETLEHTMAQPVSEMSVEGGGVREDLGPLTAMDVVESSLHEVAAGQRSGRRHRLRRSPLLTTSVKSVSRRGARVAGFVCIICFFFLLLWDEGARAGWWRRRTESSGGRHRCGNQDINNGTSSLSVEDAVEKSRPRVGFAQPLGFASVCEAGGGRVVQLNGGISPQPAHFMLELCPSSAKPESQSSDGIYSSANLLAGDGRQVLAQWRGREWHRLVRWLRDCEIKGGLGLDGARGWAGGEADACILGGPGPSSACPHLAVYPRPSPRPSLTTAATSSEGADVTPARLRVKELIPSPHASPSLSLCLDHSFTIHRLRIGRTVLLSPLETRILYHSLLFWSP